MKKYLNLNFALTFACLSFLSSNTLADEIKLKESARKDLSIAIYNEDLALVKDKREIKLNKGVNDIAFEEVSANIRPETAILNGSDIRTLEQNFNYDLLSIDSLINKGVGSEVSIIRTNPANGQIETKKGQIVANNGSVLVKVDGQIQDLGDAKLGFDKIPEGLRIDPTLVLKIFNPNEGLQDIELKYLTGGLSWQADYIANIDDKLKKMDINALVTLNNHSGVAYKNADLRLMAGDINRVSRRSFAQAKMNMEIMEDTVAAAGYAMDSKAFSDYHLYTLSNKVDILNNQTKQVSMFSVNNVNYKKQYRFDNLTNIYKGNTPEFKNNSANVFILFKNSKENSLGIAMPKGTVRVYEKDTGGETLFVGEDNIKHTSKNEEVELKTGKAFDVKASGKQTEYRPLGQDVYENTYEITFTNNTSSPANILYRQNIYGKWKILQSSIPYKTDDASRASWDLTIAPNQEITLIYQVQVSNR